MENTVNVTLEELTARLVDADQYHASILANMKECENDLTVFVLNEIITAIEKKKGCNDFMAKGYVSINFSVCEAERDRVLGNIDEDLKADIWRRVDYNVSVILEKKHWKLEYSNKAMKEAVLRRLKKNERLQEQPVPAEKPEEKAIPNTPAEDYNNGNVILRNGWEWCNPMDKE